MILVTGATGTTGREIIRELKEAGAKDVRVLARDPEKARDARDAGFEVAQGDFNSPETLKSALKGAERALLLTPPSPQTFEQQKSFIEAAKGAGVRHIVKLSAIGADASSPEGFGKWHGQAEDALKSSGLAYTMLQPNFFMQNLLAQASSITSQNAIYHPVAEARASFIDVRDIAAVAAKTLTEDGHEGRTYVLTGPEALAYEEVAGKLSIATGRDIKYVQITDEQFRSGALQMGLPEWLVSALERLNELMASGKAARVTEDVRRVAGREPFTFDLFARDYAGAFK